MTDQTQEDYNSMPSESPDQVISLPALALAAGDDGTIAMGDIAVPADPIENVSIYTDSITAVSYSSTDPVVAFDVVFSVNISGASAMETYKVVKRIGVDRAKIAAEARAGKPTSIVENKKPVNEAFIKQMRQLAGLN